MAKHFGHTPHQPETVPVVETTETSLRRWEVSLAHSPTLVVEAKDEEGAWLAYKAALGIIASDHKPKIVEVTEAAEVKEAAG